ncbi:hypothetical protein KKB54_00020 [bacterium]|nr:hypothetical protein [bacterium]MBU1153805.1 hypothetical protein [bacterium]MBU2599602.1 hypothetical protein [bacterium]
MSYQHKNLADGRWFELSFPVQMANIGSEVNRAINWKNKNNPEYSRQAFERVLELLHLTISDPKNKKRLRELTRLYEILADYFAFDNEYGSTDQSWQNYFLAFNYLARARY